jgi:hypothetical protein
MGHAGVCTCPIGNGERKGVERTKHFFRLPLRFETDTSNGLRPRLLLERLQVFPPDPHKPSEPVVRNEALLQPVVHGVPRHVEIHGRVGRGHVLLGRVEYIGLHTVVRE